MTTMQSTRAVVHRLLAASALTLLLGLAAACGTGSDDADDNALPDAAGTSSASPSGDDDDDLDPEDAMLKFAQCMREHGVDMPDPEPGGGVRLNADGLSEEQVEAAQAACQKWMDMAEPEDGGRELTEEEKQSFLDMAACMRERGYDFPDPTFEGGRVTQKMEGGPGSGPGPDDESFQRDMEECSAAAGLEPPGTSNEDGPETDERS
jgi:hypothetical protein